MKHLTVPEVITIKQALMNPVIPIVYISDQVGVSKPTVYKIMNGKDHRHVGINGRHIPSRSTGGEPLHKFLSYHDLSLNKENSRESHHPLEEDDVLKIRTIYDGIPFIKARPLGRLYNIHRSIIHNIIYEKTFTNITSSYNDVMELQKTDFLNGKPFTD